MKKIISLFKRDYEGNRLVYDEVVPGAEWVLAGEGIPTEKFDGTACMVQGGVLYKRYDRKLTKSAMRLKRRFQKNGEQFVADPDKHFKPAPGGWVPTEDAPNIHTGHWPGWLKVDFDRPENKWHKEAWSNLLVPLRDGTYELVGPKIQGNPHGLSEHAFWRHGMASLWNPDGEPLSFDEIKNFLDNHHIEGIVWHHPDGRMVKIKRRDFGFDWPVKDGG